MKNKRETEFTVTYGTVLRAGNTPQDIGINQFVRLCALYGRVLRQSSCLLTLIESLEHLSNPSLLGKTVPKL